MKRINLMIAGAVCFITLFLNTRESFGQSENINELSTTKGHIIRSGFNNKTYRLYVSLPKHYYASDTIHYPVLYVLDGKFSFTAFQAIREVLDLGKEIKEVIIVAIADSNTTESGWMVSRYYDFTPSSVPQSDTQWSKMLQIPPGQLKSGGAEMFLATLQKELIPFIDKNYKTTADRGLSGHSLGGLFAGYCLVKKPGMFTRYAINSPSFWWNNNEAVELEHSLAKQQTSIPATIFFSVGALEGEMMIGPMTAFINSLKSHHYKDIIMTTQIFDGETHLSVVPACSSRTLKVLYGTAIK